MFFIESKPEDSLEPPSHLPQVSKEKWRPPISSIRPELELFYPMSGVILFPFVTTFNQNLPDVGRIIKKNLHILDSNLKLKELFPPNSIFYPSFRRSKNLKELLAPSGHRTTSEERLL